MEDCKRDVVCEEGGYAEKEGDEENDFWAQKTKWYAHCDIRRLSTKAFNLSTTHLIMLFVFAFRTRNRSRGLFFPWELNCGVRFAGATFDVHV
jgi:hypothetical protein